MKYGAKPQKKLRDYWVDSRTKRLVTIHQPGLDCYDPDKDPTRYNPPEVSHSSQQILGCVTRDFAGL